MSCGEMPYNQHKKEAPAKLGRDRHNGGLFCGRYGA